jgi:DNA polymerase-3 subunit delta
MSLDILKTDISSNKLRRIYYIYGNEDYLKKFYLNEIKRITVSKEAEDFDFFKIDGKHMSIEDFSEQLEQFPIISEKKMIVITDLPFSSPVRNYIQKNPQDLPEDTVVVLYYIDEKYDERTKDFKTFKAVIEQNGLIVEINSPDLITMKKWVNQLFKKRQKFISEDSVNYLLFNIDNDMNIILNEVNKLTAYCDKTITNKDIDAVCIKTVDAKTYDLTDAVLNKDSNLSFKLVNKLFEMQTNVQVLLGALFSTFCNLYKIKILLIEGLNADEISKKLNMRDFVVKKNIKKLQNIDEAKLCRIIDSCIEADLAAKSTTVDEKVIITKLIVEGINIL